MARLRSVFDLRPIELLSGRVLDPKDVPGAGARATVSSEHGEAGFVGERRRLAEELTAVADAEGAFVFDELLPGSYRLQAYCDGFLASTAQVVEVARGLAVQDIELRLREGASVEGWVLPGAGEPVEGQW